MQNSDQTPYPNQDINIIVPAPRAKMLLDALFLPTEKSGQPAGGHSRSDNPKAGATDSTSATAHSSSSSSGSSCSPSLLPPLQLSTSTLSASDFPTVNHNHKTSVPHDGAWDTKTPFSKLGLVYGVGTCPTARTESVIALKRHMDASFPRVEAASKKLQQVLGLRNDEAFKTPKPPGEVGSGTVTVGSVIDFNPALRHLKGSNAGLGLPIRKTNFSNARTDGEMTEAAMEDDKQQIGGNTNFQVKILQNAEKRGLRELLLLHGKQPYGNQSRTELRSITFHDLTPDIRTGRFKNELLAHFEADAEFRTRLVCYEVDVPASQPQQPTNLSNGSMPHLRLPQTERWISFLISTPLISFKPNTIPVAPANFPTHIPSSWLVFAAPLSNVTSYPPSKDSILDRLPDGSENLRQVNRLDFDFSHNGVPVFEFMDKTSALGAVGTYLTQAINGPFIRAKGLEGYVPGHDIIYKPGTSSEQSDDDAETADDDEIIHEDFRRWEDTEDMAAEMFNSWWWTEAQLSFLEDSQTWARIKESMARGCCRVVLRVNETALRRAGVPWPGTGMGMGMEMEMTARPQAMVGAMGEDDTTHGGESATASTSCTGRGLGYGLAGVAAAN